MRALLAAVLAAVLAVLAACAGGPAAVSEREAEREAAAPSARSLFDGSSLAGWEGDARFWRAEGGALVGESTPERPCDATTYLVWRDGAVVDFELELEWRFPGGAPGNSGVQFRSRAPAPTGVAGYQADLESGPDWTGGLYEQDGRGVVTRRGERVVLDAAGARSVERFADGAELLAGVDPGAWNRLRVVAFGPRLTIEVNGELFSETIDLDAARSARNGSLALQLHAGPPMRVEFRDIRLRALSEPPSSAATSTTSTSAPQWIWPAAEVADGQVAWFRRRFELEAEPERAELWISADNRFDAWLAGERVATGDDWERPLRVDVTERVRRGANELVVRAVNESSAAGLVLELAVELAGGARHVVVSDAAFESCLAPADASSEPTVTALDETAPWSPARSLGALGVAPWGALGEALDDAGEAPAAETIRVPAGFTVELVHSVPRASQGSWVSLAADPLGRLYASDQYGGLYRVTHSREGTRVEPLALELGEAHGLLWAFDSLYAVVSGAGAHASGLYRARDADGDGELETVELLRAFEGDGEHGPHGLVLHPDGRTLVITGGNHTAPPGPFQRSRLPPTWGEDVLLAPYGDPNGHAVGITAPGGWIARTDPDGRSWELVGAGLRNAYDLAYSHDGELFTWDSDMEWDVGLPWYRATRIVHVVSGAEFGWRTGSANWPNDHYDSLAPVDELGLGSPTGLVFGDATGFPAPWRRALFACDWAYGRIHAVFLEPDGASYRGTHEIFASGEPFAVTDAVAGADGALYVAIGGRKTQSGLYRIAWEGSAAEESEPIADAGADARARRRSLEAFHGEGSPFGEDQHGLPAGDIVARALDGLGDPDRALRWAARIALEHQDPALWEAAVLSEEATRPALEGLLALVRTEPECEAHVVVERALALYAAAADSRERLDALRLLSLVLIRLDAGDAERARIREALDGGYPSLDRRLDRALLELLVACGADVAERALDELERADSQEERIAIQYALRALEVGWNDVRARRLAGAFERELASLAGGLSAKGYVEVLRDEFLARVGGDVVADAAAATSGAPDASLEPAASAQARLVAYSNPRVPRSTHPWTLAELEPSLADVARGRNPVRGRDAYVAASCHTCHRLANEGANFGPDLTGAAGRYSARDLLLALLEPSREVPDVWRDLELWGEADEDGDARLLAVGRLESERDGELVVRATSGASVVLASADVAERVPHELSRMPEGLLDALTRDEVLDLLAYVLAGGDPADERFR